MNLIETYEHRGEGFAPMFINEKWQVAQLNHDPAETSVQQIDIHFETDELFVLLEGEAVLIAAEKDEQERFTFQTIRMQPKVVYNIPRMTWHYIYMPEGAEVLIFEDKDSHLGKYERRPLAADQAEELNAMIAEAMAEKVV